MFKPAASNDSDLLRALTSQSLFTPVPLFTQSSNLLNSKFPISSRPHITSFKLTGVSNKLPVTPAYALPEKSYGNSDPLMFGPGKSSPNPNLHSTLKPIQTSKDGTPSLSMGMKNQREQVYHLGLGGR
jgi:hypothetical protein